MFYHLLLFTSAEAHHVFQQKSAGDKFVSVLKFSFKLCSFVSSTILYFIQHFLSVCSSKKVTLGVISSVFLQKCRALYPICYELKSSRQYRKCPFPCLHFLFSCRNHCFFCILTVSFVSFNEKS